MQNIKDNSGHAKRVLMYTEKGGNHDYCKINVSIEPIENYIFSERIIMLELQTLVEMFLLDP